MENKRKKLILILGYPGTGKTTIGNFLERRYNYRHVDMEENHNTSKIINNYKDFVNKIFSKNQNIVATWGFNPDKEIIDTVNNLKKYGFNIFWFFGNLNSSRNACLRRKNFKEDILQKQVNSLNKWCIPKKISVKKINVFDKNNKFRNVKDIVAELFSY